MMSSLLLITDSPLNIERGTCFEPVLRELTAVKERFHFDRITWYGYDGHEVKANVSCPDWLTIVGHKAVGGKGLLPKLRVLYTTGAQLRKIKKLIGEHEYIHLRGPSFPALLATLFCQKESGKKYWIKYAGNWSERIPPISYRLQRFLLRKSTNALVTVNGFWPNEPKHIVSFENPCLTPSDRINGVATIQEKIYKAPFNLIFIGRLEEKKGVLLVLETLSKVDHTLWNKLVIIGDGPLLEELQEEYPDKARYNFLGYSSLDTIHQELKNSHFLLLPTTASEGFPKVLAEAINYGVIPIVTDISSISHYIKNKEILVDYDFLTIDFKSKLNHLLRMSHEDILTLLSEIDEVADLYTFDSFLSKLSKYYIDERKH